LTYASDVNTIFAITDLRHKFHQEAVSYFGSKKNEKYVLLLHVHKTFKQTYSRDLKDTGDIVVATINRVRKELSERRAQTPPGESLKHSMLKATLARTIEEFQDRDYSPTDYKYYLDLLLKEFPLLELLNEPQKFDQFENHFMKLANQLTDQKIKQFIKMLKNPEICPKLDPYKVREKKEWLMEIKREHHGLFKSPDDEDIRLAAEFFTYCSVRKIKLNFSTLDNNMFTSLRFLKKDVECGDIVCLLPRK